MTSRADGHSGGDYIDAGRRRALALGNRGPLVFDPSGGLEEKILDGYWRHGFYVFENVLRSEELADLDAELASVLERAPRTPGAPTDTTPFQYARPLSDPLGGTNAASGRHPAKMTEYDPAADAPEQTIYFIYGILQLMDSCLRLYGHPGLLRVAEAVNGADFAPFADSIWIKEPGLGTSTAWHQDGTTHWDHPAWDEGIHGFNFMAQLHSTTAENALWVLPGSHKLGKVDIVEAVAAAGSDRLPDAVPMLCERGDVAVCNRQCLHGSFANTSADRRVSIVWGFHRRDAVTNVATGKPERPILYDEARIHARSRLIPLAIDARAQRFPDEKPYRYQPLLHEIEANRWNEETRETVLKDYARLNLTL